MAFYHSDGDAPRNDTHVSPVRNIQDQLLGIPEPSPSPPLPPPPALGPAESEDDEDRRISALAFAALRGLPRDRRYLAKLGRAARRFGAVEGLKPVRLRHEYFPHVNAWPARVWDKAVRTMQTEA